MKKSIKTLTFSCLLLFTAMVAQAQLSSGNTIVLSDNVTSSGIGWTYNSALQLFTITGDVIITGTTTANQVVVDQGSIVNITLNNASINVSSIPTGICAFDIGGGTGLSSGSTVYLTLVGTNTLISGPEHAGLEVLAESELHINGTGSLTATGGTYAAGIGGGGGAGTGQSNAGIIVIEGGTISATAIDDGAGIGSGRQGVNKEITINGGTVTASSINGAGIGGGLTSNGGNITITGGIVNTTSSNGAGIGGGRVSDGGNITITGGIVNTTSSNGAGIGGGSEDISIPGGNGGTITISNTAVVTAMVANGGGAGIGGGNNGSGYGNGGNGGAITISNTAVVTATVANGNGAGIGGGAGGNSGTILINGGTVNASGSWGAGIGGGIDGDCVSITINDGTVHAIANSYGTGIGGGRGGAGGVITINGGTVTGENQAPGDGGFGIGPGHSGINDVITIIDGTVNAISSSNSAGISGAITINDGTLNALQNRGVGNTPTIDGTIDIQGGEVYAINTSGSAFSTTATIDMSDGMITAISNNGVDAIPDNTVNTLPLNYLYWVNASAPVLPPVFTAFITAPPTGTAFPVTSSSAYQYVRIRAGVLSTTTLTSSLNPSVLGQNVTFTATVTAPNVGPSLDGSIQFYINGVPSGGNVMINSSGIATMSIATLSAGTHTITAEYSGDGTYTPSISNTLNQTVNIVPLISTTTQLTSDANPSDLGDNVTFIATVTPGAAAGTVQFYVDGVPEGAPVTLNAYNEATIAISTLSVGTHFITAEYNGSITHALSSDNLTQTVNWAPTPVEAINIAAAKEYDGTSMFTEAQIDITSAVLTGISGGDDVVLSKAGARGVSGPNAGTGVLVFATPLTLTGADADKYILIPPTVTATITPKAITVKATGGSSNYGDSPENPGVTATGLVPGQTASVLTGLRNSFGITSATAIGVYTLTVEDALTNSNYTVAARETGAWIVNKRPLTVAAVSQSIGEKETPVLRYEITEGSLLAGDQLTGELSCPPPYTIGTHPITQGTLSAPDYYALTFIPGILTVFSTDVSIEEIVVDGEYPLRNGNNYNILSPCGANSANINVSVGQYATVRINGQLQNSTTVYLPKYGDNVFDIVVTSQSSASAAYTLTIHRSVPVPIAFFDRFYDVLTVPAHIEGIDGAITSVEWYHNGNRLDRDSGKGYLEMKEIGVYYALLNGSIRTCEVHKTTTLSAAMMSASPNPAGANQEITVKINRPVELLQGARLQLHNINGQLLKTVPVTDNNMNISAPGYSGVVIVKLISDSGNEEVKLIIK